jgi:hypothetical protein
MLRQTNLSYLIRNPRRIWSVANRGGTERCWGNWSYLHEDLKLVLVKLRQAAQSIQHPFYHEMFLGPPFSATWIQNDTNAYPTPKNGMAFWRVAAKGLFLILAYKTGLRRWDPASGELSSGKKPTGGQSRSSDW